MNKQIKTAFFPINSLIYALLSAVLSVTYSSMLILILLQVS